MVARLKVGGPVESEAEAEAGAGNVKTWPHEAKIDAKASFISSLDAQVGT